jgi:hypothetical protein
MKRYLSTLRKMWPAFLGTGLSLVVQFPFVTHDRKWTLGIGGVLTLMFLIIPSLIMWAEGYFSRRIRVVSFEEASKGEDPKAVAKAREILLQELPPSNFAAEAYPNTSAFWDSPNNLLVYDTFNDFAHHWSWVKKSPGVYDGRCNCHLVLNDEWTVYESDGCMDWHRLTFVFRGKPAFDIRCGYTPSAGRWVTRIKHDLTPVVHELRPLILPLLEQSDVQRAMEFDKKMGRV